MEQPDEKMWELEVSQCDDGDILIAQGRCGCGDDVLIRLHRSQIPLIAKLAGFVPIEDVENAEDQLLVRIGLMALLVRAHIKPGEPLRVAIDALANNPATKPLSSPLGAYLLGVGDQGGPSIAECVGGHSERFSNDLFSEKVEGCWRALKFDHPCSFKIDQGEMPIPGGIGCG